MNHSIRSIHAAKVIMIMMLALLSPLTAEADPANGDFESAGSDWTATVDPGLGVSFPAAGGQPGGFALLESAFQNPGGRACIEQTFECGAPGGGTACTIGYDYFLELVDGVPGSGRLIVEIDGVMDTVVDLTTPGWEFVSYVVPCGTHTLSICLEVDPQDNRWIAGVDNVRSACTGPVSEQETSWSTLKSMYGG